MSYLHTYQNLNKKLHPSSGNLQLQHSLSQSGAQQQPYQQQQQQQQPPLQQYAQLPSHPPSHQFYTPTGQPSPPSMLQSHNNLQAMNNPHPLVTEAHHHQLPTLSHTRSAASMKSIGSHNNLNALNQSGTFNNNNAHSPTHDLAALAHTNSNNNSSLGLMHRSPSKSKMGSAGNLSAMTNTPMSNTPMNMNINPYPPLYNPLQPPPHQPPILDMKNDRDIMPVVNDHFVAHSLLGDIRDGNRCQAANIYPTNPSHQYNINDPPQPLNIQPLALGTPGKQQQPKHYIGRR